MNMGMYIFFEAHSTTITEPDLFFHYIIDIHFGNNITCDVSFEHTGFVLISLTKD
jgi:hypothetical protein